MSAFTGTGRLARLILRQERVKLAFWVLALGSLPAITAQSFLELYSTEASRRELAATIGSNPAFSAILGPLRGSSIGALTTWRLLVIIGTLVGVMAVLTMIRHTRLEEETGRRELLGSTVVGRHGPLAAAILVTVAAALVAGIVQLAGLIGVGLEAPGSVAFALATAGMGTFFAGVAAVAAQLSASTGVTRGIGLGALGAFFLLRIVSESTGVGALAWLTPFGWAVELSPFAGERWWVVVAWLAGFLALCGLALALSSRRDVGEGWLARRAGVARAGAGLRGPLGLAWRQHRAGLVGWCVAVAVMGVVMGSFAESIGGLVADSPQLAEILAMLGGVGGITDAFFMSIVGIVAILVSGYAIRTVLRLQQEEELLRTEFILSTATTRARLAGSHLMFALAGPAVMLAVSGVVAGIVYGLSAGQPFAEAARIASAALAHLPAVWVMAGVATALYGAAPGLTGVAWAALVAFLFLGQLGPILGLPQWAMNLSPFTHVPAVPVEPFEPAPVLWLVGVALTLTFAGLARFRTRDVPWVG